MEKIISFSLYGNNSIYCNGAIENAKLIPKIYGDDWKIIFYIRDVPEKVINELKELNCHIIDMNNSDIKNGRLHRFLSINENNIVMIRDCDSIVTIREKMMVNEFLNSGKRMHIIRDHPNHKEHVLACSFGFNRSKINVKEYIYRSGIKDNTNYIMDQVFLAKFIYPLFKKDMLIHDNFNYFNREKDEIIIKYPRVINHIGQRILNGKPEDTLRLDEFKGCIKFAKNRFNNMYELIDTFCNYLSISRSLKRILVFDTFYINDQIILLDDFLLIKELYRYTCIARNHDNKNEVTITSELLETNRIKVSDLIKIKEFDDIYLLNVDIDIINDTDYDEFTLYNIIQLNDEINYKIDEYIEKNKLDRYNTVILHNDKTIDMKEIIKYNDIFNDFSEDKNINDLIKLFSGMFRIHVGPNKLVQKFCKRYWHSWDDEFMAL